MIRLRCILGAPGGTIAGVRGADGRRQNKLISGLEGHWWVLLLILGMVFVIWGPGKMPEVGAGMGRAIREFRSSMSGVGNQLTESAPMPVAEAVMRGSGPSPHPSDSTSAPPELQAAVDDGTQR